MPHVVIIGGGITGLAAAYTLEQQARQLDTPLSYTLLEASPRLGGKIITEHTQGFLIEGGPDSFLASKSAAVNLCKALGLEGDLIPVQSNGGTFVVRHQQLHPLPTGMGLIAPTQLEAFRESTLFTDEEREAFLAEESVAPRESDEDESLASFVRRRFGDTAVNVLAEPMYAGVHVGDAERLSIKAAFPQFHDLERRHGSLTRAARAMSSASQAPGKPAPSPFVTFKNGMGALSAALASNLHGKVQMRRRVTGIRPIGEGASGLRVEIEGAAPIRADAVILSVLPSLAAELLRDWTPQLATQMCGVRTVSSATISLAYRRESVPHPLNGTGFIIPRSEPYRMYACTWSSSKFPGRAPEGTVLMRAFLSGSRNPELFTDDHSSLLPLVKADLRQLLGITDEPLLTRAFVWEGAHPQYDLGHKQRTQDILAHCPSNVFLTGAGYQGIGVPDCIAQGTSAASAALEMFKKDRRSPVRA